MKDYTSHYTYLELYEKARSQSKPGAWYSTLRRAIELEYLHYWHGLQINTAEHILEDGVLALHYGMLMELDKLMKVIEQLEGSRLS